ncbi:MAG: FAD-dependent oxidoreductase [Clostridia bacterium]|nr:FAD-dependent oxidoreductase [Clostridia bacterium]
MLYDVIVVGGGPAGMTAALYASRAGKSVLLVEAEACGGQILESQKIENYPALPDADGYTFAENLKGQITALGVAIENGRVGKVEDENGTFCAHVGEKRFFGRTVILATGLKHRKLGVAGEAELIGRGVSFCATCDGMFFRRREVAVIGGGNTAVQDALMLSAFCSKVYLIHRRMDLRAERHLAERLREHENIEFIGDTVVREMRGDGRLEELVLQRVGTENKYTLAVAGAFEAIGQLPQNEAFASLAELDGEGYFLADEQCRTSHPGVFAAGDGRRKAVRQLTTAVSDGTLAALSAVAYLDALN